MNGEDILFSCCPYCKSENVIEKTSEYHLEMERVPVEYQHGKCLDCGKTWDEGV